MQLPLRMGLLFCLSSVASLGCDETMPIRGDQETCTEPPCQPDMGTDAFVDRPSISSGQIDSGFTDPVQNLDAAPIDTGMPRTDAARYVLRGWIPRQDVNGIFRSGSRVGGADCQRAVAAQVAKAS